MIRDGKDLCGIATLRLALLRCARLLGMADLVRCCTEARVRGHLVVVAEPYLSAMIAGGKTIESRWSKTRMPPYGRVESSDMLLLKEVAGPIRAIAAVEQVEAYGPLPAGGASRIMDQHWAGLALEDVYRDSKHDDAFGTLMFLGEVCHLKPLSLAKRDRRAWVVLEPVPLQLE